MKPKLISNLEEIQNSVPVNMTSIFETVTPFLSNAERIYLLPLIGKAQFRELAEVYKAANYDLLSIVDGEIRDAIAICQKIVSNLGYYFAIPVLSVSVGLSGIQITSNSDTKNAFQWQVEDLKDSLLELGFSAIEELLSFLEENPDKFRAYMDSEQRLKQQQFLVENAAEFSEHFNINNSSYVFRSIAYIMKRVEDQTVKQLIGSEFFNSLKSDALEGKKKELVDVYLKPGIILLTASKALVERVINFENGVARINFKGNYENIKESMPADREQVFSTREQLEIDGAAFIQAGIEFIATNPVDFAEYSPQPVRRRFKITNDPSRGIFGI